MKKIKVSEAEGAALDWLVAKCEGKRTYIVTHLETGGAVFIADADLEDMEVDGSTVLAYSTDWAQGGPIIEREEISVEFGRADFITPWIAYKLGLPHEDNPEGGSTPLIAAMRCYVASKLGDTVEVPEELL